MTRFQGKPAGLSSAMASVTAQEFGEAAPSAKCQKFFASFFQKRSACLRTPPFDPTLPDYGGLGFTRALQPV
jgi:hypothetical protein